MRSREIVQTYDQHLGPVNTITFVDGNRRFLTTSDDKTIRGWDYDIPVVIKYIAEPYMHSMPAVAKHPSGKSAMSSSANRFRQVRGLPISGQSNLGVRRRRQFPTEQEETVRGAHCRRIRMSTRILSRWQIHLVGHRSGRCRLLGLEDG